MPSELYENIYGREDQFSFGENWRDYLEHFSEERLEEAKRSIQKLSGLENLSGRRFLDAGCGSGVFSLAARLLGAKVMSIDVDASSIQCCQSLKANLNVNDDDWEIRAGSVLDEAFVSSLGTFDIVYSWGVLHHTGNMWLAMNHVASKVKSGGLMILALYNKTEPAWIYRGWKVVKIIYNKGPRWQKSLMIKLYSVMFFLLRFKGHWSKFKRYTEDYQINRGMHYTHDVIDWLGGYPYEVASKKDIEDWCVTVQLNLEKVISVAPTESGCNEFVLKKTTKELI